MSSKNCWKRRSSIKIVFFGTSSFAARVLSKLIEGGQQIVAIVTRPDRLKGRHLQPSFPPVKETALAICPTIPLFQPEKASTPEFVEELKNFEADLFVVVAYGEIIKKNVLELPRRGCVNIHASLLPKFRGAAPIQRCLMAGDAQSGITIIEMSPQMDAGDVLAIEAIPVPSEMTFGELDAALCDLSVKLIFKVIRQFKENSVTKVAQDHTQATLAPKLTPEEEKIDWNQSAREIHNKIRALSPAPGAWCQIKIGGDSKRLKIKKSSIVESSSGSPGELLSYGPQGWVVSCGNGALRLIEVQLEGKKAMSAEDCMRGIHAPVSIT
jgi:methionyl-tRNA formyltransferase